MTKAFRKSTNTEKAMLMFWGQTLQFVWRHGAVKIFVYLLMIISITSFAFSFKIPPLIAFGAFVLFCVGIIIFLMWLIKISPELFQDSGTWFNYVQFMEGHKGTGLRLPSLQNQPVQPILQTKTISAKAKIVEAKQI